MANRNSSQSREDHRDTESILSAYMDNTLTREEAVAFENELSQDPFLADALEGLKQSDPATVAHSVTLLKRHLQQQLQKKGKPKHRRPSVDGYIYWAIAIVLLLAVCTFLVLQFLRHR